MVLAIGSVMCDADRWRNVALFGNNKREWLKQCLDLPNGIPSRATCSRVFAILDPQAVQRRFMAWVQAITGLTTGHVITVDGKQVRGSENRTNGRESMRLVHAWVTANQVGLGEVPVEKHRTRSPPFPVCGRCVM